MEDVRDIGGPGSDGGPVAEVAIWRLHDPNHRASAEPKTILVELPEKEPVLPSAGLGKKRVDLRVCVGRRLGWGSKRPAAKQPGHSIGELVTIRVHEGSGIW